MLQPSNVPRKANSAESVISKRTVAQILRTRYIEKTLFTIDLDSNDRILTHVSGEIKPVCREKSSTYYRVSLYVPVNDGDDVLGAKVQNGMRFAPRAGNRQSGLIIDCKRTRRTVWPLMHYTWTRPEETHATVTAQTGRSPPLAFVRMPNPLRWSRARGRQRTTCSGNAGRVVIDLCL